MSEDEAAEYFEFNVVGAWVGESTPVFVRNTNIGGENESREIFCKVLGEKFKNENDHIMQFDILNV